MLHLWLDNLSLRKWIPQHKNGMMCILSSLSKALCVCFSCSLWVFFMWQHFMSSHIFWGQMKRQGLICWQSSTVPARDWPELKWIWLWRRQWPICFAVTWSSCLSGRLFYIFSVSVPGCPHCLNNSRTFIISLASFSGVSAMELTNFSLYCVYHVCMLWTERSLLLWPGLVVAKVLELPCHNARPCSGNLGAQRITLVRGEKSVHKHY